MKLSENYTDTCINTGFFPGRIPENFVFGNDLKVDVRTGNLVSDGHFMTNDQLTDYKFEQMKNALANGGYQYQGNSVNGDIGSLSAGADGAPIGLPAEQKSEPGFFEKLGNLFTKGHFASDQEVAYHEVIDNLEEKIENGKPLTSVEKLQYYGAKMTLGEELTSAQMEDLTKSYHNSIIYDKYGDRVTGENENFILLNDGGKILKGTNYHSQIDNLVHDPITGNKSVNGENMCQLTALAMHMEQLSIEQYENNLQYEDELYSIAKTLGVGGSNLWNHFDIVGNAVIDNYDEDLKFNTYGNSDQVDVAQQLIDNGKSVIINIGGHYVNAVGYDKEGFIVHDPYGNKNNDPWKGSDGAYVRYNYNQWLVGKKRIHWID